MRIVVHGQQAFGKAVLEALLKRGEEVHVREHQFLAATGNIDYSFERVRGLGRKPGGLAEGIRPEGRVRLAIHGGS